VVLCFYLCTEEMKFLFVVKQCFCVAAFLSASVCSAQAELASVNGVTVTTVDVQGDALRIPAETRKSTLSKPEAVFQLANNVMIRRAFAAQAEAAGMDKDPAVQAAIKIARDRLLSDMMFARIDTANKPTNAALEALANSTYKSNPKRFDLPEETRARHILIRLETADAKAKASEILADLQKGADFATVAKDKSQDPGSASQGGDLGFFAKGRMVAVFEDALAKLTKPGELSGLVESQFGFHIIKLEERKSAGIRPFEEVKEVLIREASAKVLNDARLVEVQKVQDKIKFNQAAMEDFANSNK
jgi:peptidyl-prolyl cis-trans isomerase C